MNLIGALTALGLFSLMVLGGITYLNPEAPRLAEQMALLQTGFAALDAAYRSGRLARIPAVTPETWATSLFPAFGRLPRAPQGFSWTFGRDVEGAWFCLWGQDGPGGPVRTAADRLTRRFATGVLRVSDACGNAPPTDTGRLAVTYRLD